MHLSKPDILQAAMISLTLVASAVAVPVMASGQNYHPSAVPSAQHTQQPDQ